ncbi:MAG: response regulator transcription factor [Chloroflexota bacterium]
MPSRPATDRPATATGPILVVDDDRKIVALVRAYLEREGFTVLAAHDGAEALRRIREDAPALVVLDVMLPGTDGLVVARTVRAAADPVPILMLSARGSVPDRILGLERGADDYLVKPFSPAELVARVKVLLRRAAPPGATAAPPPAMPATPAPGALLRHADLVVDLERHEVRQGDRLVPLTSVELRLLVALLSADGRVLSRDQLLDAVYGATGEGEVLDRTVDVHIGRLRDKLGDDAAAPRYVATVRGAGYRAAPPPAPEVG